MQIGVETAKAVDNKRVFVVDADEITRAALQFMLHDENETHELADIASALHKSREWKPHLIILGVGVLETQGFGVVADLKAQIAGVRILLVTDTTDDPRGSSGRSAGADALLSKPLTIEKVRRAADNLLGRRRGIIPIQPI